MSTVTFFNISPKAARELLVNAFLGMVTTTDKQHIDTYGIEYELSDDEVMNWLAQGLSEDGLQTRSVAHEDGTRTYYPLPVRSIS